MLVEVQKWELFHKEFSGSMVWNGNEKCYSKMKLEWLLFYKLVILVRKSKMQSDVAKKCWLEIRSGCEFIQQGKG